MHQISLERVLQWICREYLNWNLAGQNYQRGWFKLLYLQQLLQTEIYLCQAMNSGAQCAALLRWLHRPGCVQCQVCRRSYLEYHSAAKHLPPLPLHAVWSKWSGALSKHIIQWRLILSMHREKDHRWSNFLVPLPLYICWEDSKTAKLFPIGKQSMNKPCVLIVTTMAISSAWLCESGRSADLGGRLQSFWAL